MSRDDPLAPLLEKMAIESEKKARRAHFARLSLAWFMVLLMLAWVSKFAYQML